VPAAGARAIAPDYLGFGRSDKWVDQARYSYAMHRGVVERLIMALGLTDLTVVVHDWGGPIGLGAAVRHRERVRRLVVLNTGLFGGDEPLGEGLQAWRAYAARTPDLPAGLIVRRSAADRGRVTDAIVAAYDAPFPDVASKAGIRAFPALIPTNPVDPGAREMAETRAALTAWGPPALCLWSGRDPAFPVAAGRRLAAGLPGAAFEVIDDAGHFLTEEQGDQVGRRVAAWLGGA
jgi:haloalkane dehalogenase